MNNEVTFSPTDDERTVLEVAVMMMRSLAVCAAWSFMVGCVLLLTGCGNGAAHSPDDYYSDSLVIALCEAAMDGDIKAIDAAVAEGADVNAVGKDDITPLGFAMLAMNENGFRRLLEHGADPNFQRRKDGASMTSFMARLPDHPQWLEMVLQHGGDPNLVDPVDSIIGPHPVLFTAVASRNLTNIDLLLEAGADPNLRSMKGYTAAMYATRYRWYACVYRLLQAGTDWTFENTYGQDLAFLCFYRGRPPSNAAYRDDIEAFDKVLAFLKDKGVDLDAAKKAADKHNGLN